MPRQDIYKGYSTFEFQSTKSLSLRDVELVKMDLLNHIYTQRGTRIMMPDFGTIIPEIVFEPLDEDTIDEIRDSIKSVFDYDPRVEIIQLAVTPDYDRNSVFVMAKLLYVELDTVDNFNLNIQFEE